MRLDLDRSSSRQQIYRRMILLQRRKAEHAQLYSFEQATGGVDPLLADIDFWDDVDSPPFSSPTEPSSSATIRAQLHPVDEDHAMSSPHASQRQAGLSTPPRWHHLQPPPQLRTLHEESEDERWAREAAEAEQAEAEQNWEAMDDAAYEAEEAELATRVEEGYYRNQAQQSQDHNHTNQAGLLGWPPSDAMDIE